MNKISLRHRLNMRLVLTLTAICVTILSAFVCFRLETARAAGSITGRVFQDFNGNGVYENGTGITSLPIAVDTGVAGVVVTAYDRFGINRGSTTTNANGTYSLTASGTGPYRLEFTQIPTGFQPSARSTDSVQSTGTTNAGSTVQFVADATTSSDPVNLALNRPRDYCQDNPLICSQQYSPLDVNDPLAAFAVPYNAGSTRTSGGAPVTDFMSPGNTNLASMNQIGTTFGLAYNRAAKQAFFAAYMKKHSKFGPGGTGAIYQVNLNNGAVSEYVNLNTLYGANTAGANPHNTADYNTDNGNATWDAVGKISFGGMATNVGLSGVEDFSRLYAMNLANKTLYEIPTNTTPTTANIRTSAFPATMPGCANANDVRPFAVTYYENQIYVGAVCSANSSDSASDLKAYVYVVNPTTLAYGANPVFQTALNYPRNEVDPGAPAEWLAWRTTFSNLPNQGNFVYPQPMLTDIDFDRGNLILSIRDRMGDQTGYNNASNPNNTAELRKGITAGDTLRACGNTTAGWTLENNAQCGGITTLGANTGEGPGNGEYYYQENYHPDGNPHDEVSNGAAHQIPGHLEMVASMMDPVYLPGDNIFDSGGFRWFVNDTGAQNRGYLAYQAGDFGKANGLGNVVAFCDSAPFEIGNRVWNDANANGVQDPGESPIGSATVELYTGGSTPAPVMYARYRDELTSVAYNGSNGSVNWSGTPWTEIGDDNVVTTGSVQVASANTALGNHIRIGANGNGLSRAINLAGSSSATLSFNYQTSGQGLIVSYSTNNGTSYTDLQTLAATTDSGLQTFSVVIPTNATNIRFLSNTNGNNNLVFIDNVQLSTNAVTTTDANGEYYFSSAVGASNAANAVFNTNIQPNTAYQLRFSGAALTGFVPTLPDANWQTGNQDSNDSEAAISGSLNVINLTTGNAGDNNHTFDAGFRSSAAPTLFSLGNRVWFDTNNDGAFDNSEVGIDNVSVSVFAADANGNSTGSALQTMNTDSGGYYRFDGLAAGAYVVRVNPSNFASGAVLAGARNSTAADTGILDFNTTGAENGIIPAGAENAAQTVGVLSNRIVVGPTANAPTNESGDPGPGGQGTADNQANMTIDFGFYRLNLNGTVWRDANDDGLINAGETGFNSLNVRLYSLDGTTEIPIGPDGVLGTADDAAGGVTTNSSGNYAFGGLATNALLGGNNVGSYVVKVFPTTGRSSTPTADPNNHVDSDDNGAAGTGADAGRIVSGILTITPGNSFGTTPTNNATGSTTDTTLDFGIVAAAPTSASVLIGGRVLTADGRGIRNVRVTLTEADGSERTVLTGAFGYYRFPDVSAGQTVTVSVVSKRFDFEQPVQVLSVTGGFEDLNFTAGK